MSWLDSFFNPTVAPNASSTVYGLIQLGGDLAGTGSAAATPKVGSVTGIAGVLAIACAAMEIDKGQASPVLRQAAQTTDVACSALTFKSQAPWASATGTNRNPGNCIFEVPSAASGGTDGKHSFKVAGAERLNIQKDRVVFSGTLATIHSIEAELQTAAGTIATLASFTMADNTLCAFDVIITFARRSSVTKAGRYKRSFVYRRAGGAPTIVGSVESGTDQQTEANTITIDTNSNDVRVRVTPADADGRNWIIEMRVQETLST